MSVHKWAIDVVPFEGNHKWGVYWIARIAGCTVPGKTKQDAYFKAKKARRQFVRLWNERDYSKYSEYYTDKPNWWRKYSTNGRSK